jgi:hypothetical protein
MKARPQRLGLVNFVDAADENLWGVYSIHKQMKKFGMLPTVEHIAVVYKDISPTSRALLEEWLGPEQVREIDRNFIVDKVHDDLRQGDFLKTEAFNMTEFDKLIVLDNSVLIRQSLMHWFDYPTPASTQACGVIEWNSGAMVIEPETSLYNTLLNYIPRSRLWLPTKDKGEDTWNSNDGQQGFLSAFLTSNVTEHSMYTMSYSSTILSSDLEDAKPNNYYWKFRPWVIETVHFTRHKPWKPNTRTYSPAVCAMLQEWAITVADAPKHKLPALPNFLRKCGKKSEGEDARIQAEREARFTNE